MSAICIQNANVWDGEADTAFGATVVVQGNRIDAVHRGPVEDGSLPRDRIDGTGMTLMPGMVEGHCHPSFTGVGANAELGRIPPEEHTLLAADNVKLLLDHGFT
jgi:imidazolonepropionase-like amidohydrolase